jgi:NAD(P)-dependent dehydrogenase (short-subunit alcohol dehydrogenase family)
MKQLQGKVAVITGAGSGIGRELALACAREGMRLVLADVDAKGMAETVQQIGTAAEAPTSVDLLTVPCNVAKPEQLESLASETYKRFGAAHLLFNNAGVAACGPTWTTTLEEWQWVLDVNLMGVVHGIRTFVPRMLAQADECHIVNTASAAGLTSVPGNSVYCVSKHGVVTLSECLKHELRRAKSAIGVSVLCPAFVNTAIFDSARNRPAELANENPLGAPYAAMGRKAIQAGKLSAADVARITLEGVKAGRFYVIPHTKVKALVETRMRDILDDREPTDTLRQADEFFPPSPDRVPRERENP